MDFKIHKQLQDDTHYLFEHNSVHVLLHKNSKIPWIILVPKTNAVENFELPDSLQQTINELSESITVLLKKNFAIKKMNIAAIGNIVSQLHIHIIGRKPSDACWPNVVWGYEYGFSKWVDTDIKKIKTSLEKSLSS